MKSRAFYLDTDSRSFVRGEAGGQFFSTVFFEEDVESINLFFLENAGQESVNYLDYSSNVVKFAVGTTTPAALQITWAALPTTVTVAITTLVAGGANSNEVQKLTITGQPRKGGFAMLIPQRSVVVNTVNSGVFTAANHGLFNGQSVTLNGFNFVTASQITNSTYFVINRTNSTFRLANSETSTTGLSATGTMDIGQNTVTISEIAVPSVSFDAPPSDLENALVEAGLHIDGAPQINVTGVASKEYTFAFNGACQKRNWPELQITANTLAGVHGLSARLNLNTAGIAAIASSSNPSAIIEIEVSNENVRHTYQTSATISADIISSSSPITSIVNATTNFSLNSQDGSSWNITIDNDGVLSATKQ